MFRDGISKAGPQEPMIWRAAGEDRGNEERRGIRPLDRRTGKGGWDGIQEDTEGAQGSAEGSPYLMQCRSCW
ncbi:hypothetical protein GUJ93_ZPchr0007g3251 [Zizania palustris]|uniref:Uncharacterized protein n=1 Tax=Zizania palustris TaxID=103762 RepID=A0A8J5W563_ZIZPA|nr:hypothetical protein GUJ93_ZPchr0007g3251 [Zizania palustris]